MSNGTPAAVADIGTVRPIDITNTMQEAYLDYAMSVIVSRALPDVRDGLKPVHRRILYAMYHDLNLTFNRPHKKSARIVGEVLGKYHPHGDTAVYDAMVRMAQDFSLRYMLVDGQGNFGSIDGDNAAAMRYTEARLAEVSDLMLEDLEKDTVEWHDNFDNSLREPDILPAALPNLLINGSSGIAVGMATNIPPHNLCEVVDALAFMIDRYDRLEDVTVDHLLDFIKGPDFPTGGILYRFRQERKNEDDIDVITQGYSVGKARLILQAKAHFEEMSRNRSRIVITELPYQTNKTALIERIAGLVRDGKIEGITDLRDESDRTGMRIVIELTRNVEPKDILADLFKYTPLQQTFGMQMLALVDGQPRLLPLKRMLHLFIQHREEIIRRRSEYELARAQERAHILEGLLKALDILDEVITTIRNSQRVDTARNNLMKNFGFTQIQAQAILDMQLRRLAALERKRLQDEYKELLKRIKYLEDLLAHPEKILAVIKEDLLAIKEKYGDTRRTQIVDRTKGTLTSTDLLPEQDVWVSVAANGDLGRRNAARTGKSVAREAAKDSQVALLASNTRDFLYLAHQDGRTARVPIHEISPERPKHLSDLTDFTRRDDITAAFAVPRLSAEEAQGYLFAVTELGSVKRVTLADFVSAAAGNPSIMNVESKDRIAFVFSTPGEGEVILVSSSGKSIRFSEEDVRSMGLAAGGVGGMKLKKGEKIVYAGLVDPDGELMTMTEKGYAKRTPLSDYSTQGRNGGGIVTHKPTTRTGDVSAALVLRQNELADASALLTVVTAKSKVTVMTLEDVPRMGRAVQGKQIMAVGTPDAATAIYALTDRPEPPAGENGGGGVNGATATASTSASRAGGKQLAARTRTNAKARSRAPAKKHSQASDGASTTAASATAKSAAKSKSGRTSRVAQSTKSSAATSSSSAATKPPGHKGSTTRSSTKSSATKAPAKKRMTSKSDTATTAKSSGRKGSTTRSSTKSSASKAPAKKSMTSKSDTATTAKSSGRKGSTTRSSTKSSATKAPVKKSTARKSDTATAIKSSARNASTTGTSAKSSATKTSAKKSTTSKPSTATANKSSGRKTSTTGTSAKSSATKTSAKKSTTSKPSTATANKSSGRKASTTRSSTTASAAKKSAAAKESATNGETKSSSETTKQTTTKAKNPIPTKTGSAKPGAAGAKSTAAKKPAVKKKPTSKKNAKLQTVSSVTTSQKKKKK